MCTLFDSTNINTIIEFVPKLSVACQRWWFQWRLWFVPSVPGYLRGEEEHKPDPWLKPVERNHMGLHLECIVYGKLLKPRQSFRITLYSSAVLSRLFTVTTFWLSRFFIGKRIDFVKQTALIKTLKKQTGASQR